MCGSEDPALLTDHYVTICCHGEYPAKEQFAFEVMPSIYLNKDWYGGLWDGDVKDV